MIQISSGRADQVSMLCRPAATSVVQRCPHLPTSSLRPWCSSTCMDTSVFREVPEKSSGQLDLYLRATTSTRHRPPQGPRRKFQGRENMTTGRRTASRRVLVLGEPDGTHGAPGQVRPA